MSLRTAGGISTFSPVIFDLVCIRPQGEPRVTAGPQLVGTGRYQRGNDDTHDSQARSATAALLPQCDTGGREAFAAHCIRCSRTWHCPQSVGMRAVHPIVRHAEWLMLGFAHSVHCRRRTAHLEGARRILRCKMIVGTVAAMSAHRSEDSRVAQRFT